MSGSHKYSSGSVSTPADSRGNKYLSGYCIHQKYDFPENLHAEAESDVNYSSIQMHNFRFPSTAPA